MSSQAVVILYGRSGCRRQANTMTTTAESAACELRRLREQHQQEQVQLQEDFEVERAACRRKLGGYNKRKLRRAKLLLDYSYQQLDKEYLRLERVQLEILDRGLDVLYQRIERLDQQIDSLQAKINS